MTGKTPAFIRAPDKRVKAIQEKADGRMSEARAIFVKIFARTGLAAYAAEQAGYARPQTEGSRLSNDPKVIKAVLEARQTLLEGEIGGLAYHELKHLITDRERTPASVRFSACKWALETAGHGQAALLPDSGKALADMSLAELAAFIEQGDRVLTELRQNDIQGTATRVNDAPEQQTIPVKRLEVADLLG